MSVSGVERSRKSDEVAKTRAEAEDKETKAAKKHRKEVENLRQAHLKEMEDLRSTYENAMNDQKRIARDSLNDRDRKYQGQIENLQKMNAERMRALSEEQADETTRYREAAQSSQDNERRISARQKAGMKGEFENQIRAREAQYADSMKRLQEGQTTALKEQRETLSASFGKEKKAILTERENKTESLAQDLTETRNQKEAQVREMQVKNLREKARNEKLFEDELRTERTLAVANNQMIREGYSKNLRSAQEQFGKGLQKNQADQNTQFEAFKQTVENRMDGQIENLERGLREEKKQSLGRQVEMTRLHDLESRHVREDSEKRIEDVQRQLNTSEAAHREKTKQEMDKLNRENTDVLHREQNFYRGQMDHLKNTELAATRKQVDEYKLRDETNRSQAELKAERQKEIFNKELRAQDGFYKAQISDIKQNQTAELQNVRSRNEQEKQVIAARQESLMRGIETESQKKINMLTAKYEKALEDLKEQSTKAMREQKNFAEIRNKEQQKDFQTKFESQKINHELRVAEMEERHQREMESVKRKFDAERLELAKRKT